MPLDTLLPEVDPEADTDELVRPRRSAPMNRGTRKREWNITPEALDQLDQFANERANARPVPTETPKPAKPLGLMGTIQEGARGTLRALGATADTMQGDAQGVVTAAQEQAAAPKDPDLEKFYSHIEEQKQALGENPSLWEGIKAVGGAAVDNPRGFGLMVAEQLPNSAAALGAGAAGALAGSLAGPVGAVIGGLGGLASANIGLETGHKALEAAQDNEFTPEEQSRVKREGLTKGAVITGVDAAALGVTKFITGTTRRAVERATTKTLADNGVDITNAAARKAALETPEIADAVKAAQNLAKEGADKLGKRLARTGGAVALETIGEGAGEYLGELAATGMANAVDAVVEGFAGLGTSIGEIAATSALNRKGLARLFDNPETAEKTAEAETKKTGVPHEAIQHPTEPDKFVAVPKVRSVAGITLERDADGNLKATAPASTQTDFNLANRPGFELSAEDKLRQKDLDRQREEAYARNPIIIPKVAPKAATIAGRPVTNLSDNALIYTANRGGERAKKLATAEMERRKKEVIDPAIANAPEAPADTVKRIVATGAEKAQEDGKKASVPTPTPKVVKPATVIKPAVAPAPKTAQTSKPQVVLPDNTSLDAQWDVVDADSVKASLKEGVNQPRDRSRAASDIQVQGIANNPDYRRLSDSPVMDVGAPTLSNDGAIVGGNGRFEGISRAYEQGSAKDYLAQLKADAAARGIDPAKIDAMKKPVLVRRITQPFDTRKLAVASNSGTGLQYSGLELAKIDAERMKGLEQLEVTDTGDIALTGSNIQNVRHSLGGYSAAELGSLTDKDGRLSQEGVRRIRNAMLYSAYGSNPTLERLVESTDNDLRNISGALVKAAGSAAKARAGIASGRIPAELDISESLVGAVETLSKIKANGMSVDEYLSQIGLFGEEVNEDTRSILRVLEANIRSQRKIADFIRTYYDSVSRIDTSTNDIFGGGIPTRTELLKNAKERITEKPVITQSLFSRSASSAGTKGAKQSGNNASPPKSREKNKQVRKAPTSPAQARVESVVKEVTGKWKNAPEVVILDSMDDAPPAARAENERQLSQGATGEPEGFIAGGKVYLVASQLNTPDDVVRVLLHESLGHFGLRGTFGVGLDAVLRQVATLRRKEIEAKAKQYGLDVSKESDRLIAAEEVLAEMAQTNPQSGIVQRAFAAIRSWLRRNIPGFGKMKLSDGEIIETILIPARQFVERGAQTGQTRGAIAFRRVFHGTPHVWPPEPGFPHGRPRLDKMGTGEGAQAYGWGWYSAENQGVADDYRKTLSGPHNRSLDADVNTSVVIEDMSGDGDWRVALRSSTRMIGSTGMSTESLTSAEFESAREAYEYAKKQGWINSTDKHAFAMMGEEDRLQPIDSLDNASGQIVVYDPGTLYSLDIPDSVLPRLLDWDKPLSEQTPEVRGILEKASLLDGPGTLKWKKGNNGDYDYFSDATGKYSIAARSSGATVSYRTHAGTNETVGEFPDAAKAKKAAQRYADELPKRTPAIQLYRELTREHKSDKAASEYLASIGIVGNRYLDGGSRADGKGTYNYVIWDQPTLDKVALLERNEEKLDAIREANAAFSRSATATAPAATPFRDRIDKAVDSLIYNFQDRFKPLKDIQERAGAVSEDQDAVLAEERYSGIVRARTDAFQEQMRDPLLKAIHDSGVAYEDVEEYLHALHAPSRNAAMREINPTEAELKTQTAALEQQRDSLANDNDVKAYIKARRELRDAEADIEDGIADESLGRMLNQELANLRRVQAVKDYTSAIEKLRGLRLVKPFQGDNTALSGMSDAKAKAVLAKIDANGTRKALEKISAIVDGITSATRQIYIDSGLEKADAIEAWDKKYEHYVPLHRDEVSGNTMPKVGQGFNIRGKESKRATGSTKEVTNILAHVVAQHEAAIIRSEKARVDRTLFQFASTHPDPSLWTLDNAPMLRTVDQTSGLVVERVDPTYKNRPEVLTLKIDGEEHTITFNTDNLTAMRLAASMKNLNSEQMGEVTQLVGRFTRGLAIMNTTANPVFTARNMLRDLQTAYVNLSDTAIADKKREIFRDVGPAIKGMWKLSRGDKKSQWAKYAEEFKAAGGQTGWMEHYKDIGARADTLKKELAAMGPGKTKLAWRTAKGWWDIVQDANNAVENGVRLAAFVNARRSGISEAKAAQLAKNLTVNFNAHGAKGVELNAWYMFLNASIQGSARLIKALSNKQVRKIVAGVILSGFLMDIMARSMAGDDDDDGENDYDQLPEHTKAMNFIFMVGNRPVTIPMPYGYNFFASAGRKISEVMFRENYSAVSSAADLAGVFIDAFSPTGQAGSFLQFAAPTVADPFVQWSENKNFAGNPLRRPQSPFGVPNPEYQMGFKSTSAPAKWLAEVLNTETGGNEVRPGYINVNPAFFDFAVSSIAGGAGRTYLQTVSGPMKAASDGEIQAREVPFLNIFVGAKPEYQTEKKYFEAVKKVEVAKDELATYKQNPEMAKQIREDHAAELRMRAAAAETKRILTRLRKRDIKLDDSELPNKAELRKEIEEKRRAVMSEFNKQYRNAIMAGQP